jgi:hypothetical protein
MASNEWLCLPCYLRTPGGYYLPDSELTPIAAPVPARTLTAIRKAYRG